MKVQIPQVLLTDLNLELFDYLASLSCHGDIIGPLDSIYSAYPDIQWFCPDVENFKYCVWYRNNIVIAFAEGMQNVSFRIQENAIELAKIWVFRFYMLRRIVVFNPL